MSNHLIPTPTSNGDLGFAYCEYPCLTGEVRGSKSQTEGVRPPLQRSGKGEAQRRAAQARRGSLGTRLTRARAAPLAVFICMHHLQKLI